MLVNHLEVKGVCPLGLVLPLISFMTFNKTSASSTTDLGGLSELNGKKYLPQWRSIVAVSTV